MGKPDDRTGNTLTRLKLMTLIALGQKKMFKKPLPALLHLAVYVGFLIVNIEMLEIVADGLLGTHRLFAPSLGVLYPILINVFEFFAVAVIVACVFFLVRRNLLSIARFKSSELSSIPRRDANIILVVEIILMCALLTMNSTDLALQKKGIEHYFYTENFFFSGLIAPFFETFEPFTLQIIERLSWWVHIIGVLAFANYVFYDSKHLHIFMAFINAFYSKLEAAGKLPNMASVTHEVKLMLNLPTDNGEAPSELNRFGAKDANDLTWKNLLDAYSCTECGRCTEQCPANITGKKLSPRKIMMDTRDRIEEIGKNIDKLGKANEDGKSLLDDYISSEELLACTTCNACVEACPINIDPVSIILQLRQYRIMEASKAPAAWNGMLSNIENNAAPWKFSPSDRTDWVESINK